MATGNCRKLHIQITEPETFLKSKKEKKRKAHRYTCIAAAAVVPIVAEKPEATKSS